jgi:hypothetical protein
VENRELSDWSAVLPFDCLTKQLYKEMMSVLGIRAFTEKYAAVYLIDNLSNDDGRKKGVATKSEYVGTTGRHEGFLTGLPPSDNLSAYRINPAHPAIRDDIHCAGTSRIDGERYA